MYTSRQAQLTNPSCPLRLVTVGSIPTGRANFYDVIAQLVRVLGQVTALEVSGSNPFNVTNLKYAGVAQLVERCPSKSDVVGSSPITRSKLCTESPVFAGMNQ